jgi:hypothetical protein
VIDFDAIIAASKEWVSEEEKAARAKRYRAMLDEAEASFAERRARMRVTSQHLEIVCSI